MERASRRPPGGNSPDPRGDAVIELDGRSIVAAPGSRLLDAILESGIEHRHICGGFGFCTSCRVEVVLGQDDALSPVSPLERQRLGRDAGRLRLACQTFVRGPVKLRVPRVISGRFSPDGE